MDRFEVHRGMDGQWYIRLRARNGKIVADGGEGYASKSNAKRAAQRLVRRAIAAMAHEIRVIE